MTANKGEFDMNIAHCYNIKKYYTEWKLMLTTNTVPLKKKKKDMDLGSDTPRFDS